MCPYKQHRPLTFTFSHLADAFIVEQWRQEGEGIEMCELYGDLFLHTNFLVVWGANRGGPNFIDA